MLRMTFLICMNTGAINKPLCATNSLKSFSLATTIFLIISFLLLTIAELFSVSLLKNAGGWELLEGERDPILTGEEE